MKRILLLGNCYTTIVHFRRELIEYLVKYGYDVWISFPNHSHGEKETGEDVAREIGCRFIELKMDRRTANLVKEITLINSISHLIKTLHPDCVLTFTIKPNIYCGYICRKLRIPYIMNITGLGSGLGSGLIGKMLIGPYVNSANKAYKVFFQNSNDHSFFISYGYKDINADYLPGSGVNLEKYHILPYPKNKKIVFLYNARIMKEKGIDEYLRVAKHYMHDKNIEFHICGDCEDKYEKELKELSDQRIVIYHGRVSDMIKHLEECNCVILPSFYNEGISNCLLEAAACARPIITTDHPGCREVVENGVNGYLIKKKCADDLSLKVESFINLDREKQINMGKKGRIIVEKKFDRQIVIEKYASVIKSIPSFTN